MRFVERMFLCGALVAVATVALGWWAVPIAGALVGWFARSSRRPAVDVALATAIAWALFLVRLSRTGDVGGFAATVGGVMHLAGWAFAAITLGYGAALGAAGAALGRALRPRGDRPLRAAGRPPR